MPTDWLAELVFAPASFSGATGELDLRVKLFEDNLEAIGLTEVTLYPEWGAAGTGPDRRAGWHKIPASVDRIVLPAAEPQLAASGILPAADYVRAMVASPLVRARTTSGDPVDVISHIEPIHRGFHLQPDGRVTIELIIQVLPAPGGAPGYEAFVRAAEQR